jgi:hypothetical protein
VRAEVVEVLVEFCERVVRGEREEISYEEEANDLAVAPVG